MPNSIRRLCIIHFQCPLCGLDHDDQIYVTIPADNLDEYVARLRTFARDWESIESNLTEAVIRFHREQGDLDRLTERDGRYGLHETRPPTLGLTPESEYTCADCGQVFESNPLLQEHMKSSH